jgi:uncharacterized membrane protein YbhN (UPF0104 family)
LPAKVKISLGVVIFVAFIVLVEHYVGWANLLAPWRQFSPAALLVALLLTFVSYALRAVRLSDYFAAEMRGEFQITLRIMLQHNLLNNLLPMRTGELSFPVLVQRHFDIRPIRSVPALLWFRLLDLHTLALLALIAMGSYWLPLWLLVACTLLLALLPPLAFFAHRRLQQKLEQGEQTGLRATLHKALDSLPQERRAFWRSWLWTVVNWLVKLTVFAWVLQQFAAMPWAAAWLGVLGGDLTSVLPIHGVAGAGTYEAGVVFGVVLFSVAAADALTAAVNLHLFMLGATLLGGVVSLLMRSRRVG